MSEVFGKVVETAWTWCRNKQTEHRNWKQNLRKMCSALTGVAQLVGCHPTRRKVASSIPGQGTCHVFAVQSQVGYVGEATDRCFSPSLPLSLKLNK